MAGRDSLCEALLVTLFVYFDCPRLDLYCTAR